MKRLLAVLIALAAALPALGQELPEEVIQKYCTNLRDEALEARNAWQASELARLEQRLSDRTAELEERRAQVEALIDEREALLNMASGKVAAIYAGMRPEAAAGQLSEIEPRVAAAVVAKLEPRVAGAILTEMEPRQAAALTLALAGPSVLPGEDGEAGE